MQLQMVRARMFMVRCYQNILRSQQQWLPWSPQVQDNFQSNDNNLGDLLLLLSLSNN